MQLDSTGLPVRDKEHGYSIQLGSLFAYVGDRESVVYLYGSTARKNGQRISELGPEEFLAMRSGPTLADASNAFDKSFLRAEPPWLKLAATTIGGDSLRGGVARQRVLEGELHHAADPRQ